MRPLTCSRFYAGEKVKKVIPGGRVQIKEAVSSGGVCLVPWLRNRNGAHRTMASPGPTQGRRAEGLAGRSTPQGSPSKSLSQSLLPPWGLSSTLMQISMGRRSSPLGGKGQ